MLSRQGWAMLGATVATFVVARLFGLLELYVVGTAIAAMLVFAMARTLRPLPALSVRRVARPAMVSVGESARMELHLSNDSHRSTPRLRLWEPVGDSGGAPMQLAPLPGGATVSVAYRVPSLRRGVVLVGPLDAERSDLLGLSTRRHVLAGTAEVLVVPERVPLAFPGLSSSGRLGEHLRMKSWGQTGSEFHSQREYVPGDDLRRVNWKTSARLGELIVRETAVEGIRRCTVVLDTDRHAHPDADSFERAVVAAASIVTGAAAEGIATRLVAPSIDLRGPDVARESLRMLATAEVGDEVADHNAGGRTSVDGLGLVVVCTGHADSACATATRHAAGPDDTVIVVRCADLDGSVAGNGGPFEIEATSLDSLQRGWNRLVLGTAAVPT
ncbi:MAG: hypothetical protein RI900_2897 [Actinomycetota bacterium]